MFRCFVRCIVRCMLRSLYLTFVVSYVSLRSLYVCFVSFDVCMYRCIYCSLYECMYVCMFRCMYGTEVMMMSIYYNSNVVKKIRYFVLMELHLKTLGIILIYYRFAQIGL
jgi:hypothetical protein